MAESKPSVIKSEIPVKRGPGRPVGSKKKVVAIQQKDFFLRPLDRITQDGVVQDGVILVKRGPGRPPLNRPPTVKIPTYNGRTLTAQYEEAQKKELVKQLAAKANYVAPPKKRGPKGTKHEGFWNNLDNGDHKSSLFNTHQAKKRGRVRKDILKPLQGLDDQKKRRGRPKKTMNDVIEKLKAKHQAEKGERKNKMVKQKGYIFGSKNNVIMRPMKAAEVASVTVVVGGKPRGRPRKIQPKEEDNEQVTFFNPDMWTSPVLYGQHQLQPVCEFINPYGPDCPTEMDGISPGSDLLQVPRDMASPSVDPQSSWESREAIDEDDDAEETQEHQYQSWETKPVATEWMQSAAAEYAANTLNGNPVAQWYMGSTSASQEPPSQYSADPPPAQPNYQEGLITELADFKCQLLKELAATRAEIQEGAQLVRSAIAGVSAEIHRLGQILQPLVNVITASNASWQDRSAAFAPRFQQDTPPDDTQDIVQPSTQVRTSLPHEAVFIHSPSTAVDCPAAEARLVKLEDSIDVPQLCAHQAQSSVTTQTGLHADHTMDLHNQMKLSRSKVTSSAARDPVNCPQNGTTSDLCIVTSFAKAPTARSLPSSSPVLFLGHGSQENGLPAPSRLTPEAR